MRPRILYIYPYNDFYIYLYLYTDTRIIFMVSRIFIHIYTTHITSPAYNFKVFEKILQH